MQRQAYIFLNNLWCTNQNGYFPSFLLNICDFRRLLKYLNNFSFRLSDSTVNSAIAKGKSGDRETQISAIFSKLLIFRFFASCAQFLVTFFGFYGKFCFRYGPPFHFLAAIQTSSVSFILFYFIFIFHSKSFTFCEDRPGRTNPL
jgi:hypothetical protein